MRVNQRQRACPDRQQSRLPNPLRKRRALFRRKGRKQQIKARQRHAPPAEERPLRNHQVGNHV